MDVGSNAPVVDRGPLVAEKIEAFERIRDEFAMCFTYVESVHGQHRFAEFPVENTVRYLHALWVCECKDRLLSVPRTTQRYEGQRCLELLRGWQQTETADVVEFLQRKLDLRDIAHLTRQRQDAVRRGDDTLAQRLAHGQEVLLNRGINLHRALDAIFALNDAALGARVLEACAAVGHLPDEIASQLLLLSTPAYSYAPHPLLARYNMQLMNALGVRVTEGPVDTPARRTDAVRAPDMPVPPYAEETIAGEVNLSGMRHNNPGNLDMLNAPMTVDGAESARPAPPAE